MKKSLVMALVLSLALPIAALSAEPVKIGLMAPLTGKWANEGQGMKQVVDILAEELNKSGGLLGRQVEIISEDDAGA